MAVPQGASLLLSCACSVYTPVCAFHLCFVPLAKALQTQSNTAKAFTSQWWCFETPGVVIFAWASFVIAVLSQLVSWELLELAGRRCTGSLCSLVQGGELSPKRLGTAGVASAPVTHPNSKEVEIHTQVYFCTHRHSFWTNLHEICLHSLAL